jgi:hypothetical protein
MANDLAIFEAPEKTLLLPDFLRSLAVGTVNHPGQPTRKYLAGGLNLTSAQRTEVQQCASRLHDALSPGGELGNKARGVVLAKMVMAYPMAGVSDRSGEARAEAYQDAVGDLPPWAIGEAVKRWNRGQCGDHNYSFAPAPAVLRKIVDGIVAPYRVALDRCAMALEALTLERAMDSKPIETSKSVVPSLKIV